jgi:glutathione S-transferase
MSLIVRKPTPGEQAYADWCDAPESDLARYWHRMNRADKAKWEKFGARIAADRRAVDAALRDVLEEAKRRTPQLTGDQLTGDRVAMTIGYVVIDRLRGQ